MDNFMSVPISSDSVSITKLNKKHNIREEDKRVTLNGCQNYRSQSQQSIFYEKRFSILLG